MKIEIINTGSELMLGFVTNTHHRWLCRELSRLGYDVTRQIAISDRASAIQEAVRESLSRADLVITTGGLGPTSDDLTREAIAELFGQTLREDPAVVAAIEDFFQRRRRPMSPRVRVQAMVPEKGLVLPNGNGTAPGLALTPEPGRFRPGPDSQLLIMLPGPPRELEPMFHAQVVPLLQKRFPLPAVFACKVLRSTGIGESMVEEKIESPLKSLMNSGLQVGYCARFGEVDVRLIARGPESKRIVDEAEEVVRSLIGKSIFGTESDCLEEVLVKELTARGESLALAESCTGGYIANRITNVPGASAIFVGGVVSYSNGSKEEILEVPASMLREYGAVSEPVAKAMAEGIRDRLRSTYAIAVTGIAGPGGGTPEKPVGTVFIAWAGPGSTVVLQQVNRYDRESFKFVTSQQALDLLRRKMQG